jgi:hypothetical protein
MPASDPFNRLVSVAGAAVGAVGLVYVIGAASLSLRYDGLGLAGQVSAAQTSREVLLAAGLRTLVAWSIVGVLITAALSVHHRWLARAIVGLLRTKAAQIALGVLVVALLLFSHVVWLPVAVASVIAIAYATVRWQATPVRRLGVTVLAVVVFAVAYEADRLSFYVENTRVDLEDGSQISGRLVGQQDRGFYLAVTDREGDASLQFIPAALVTSAIAVKEEATVNADHMESRRQPIFKRLLGIDVR